MIILENANEAQVVLCFLLGELSSERFGDKLKNVMKSLDVERSLVLNADLSKEKENELRKLLLGEFRGYGKNEGLFENFPFIDDYKYVKFSIEELKNIKYINYSYWNELTDYTSSPLQAAFNIKRGKVVYDVSNEPFINGVEQLEKGKCFPPLILLTSDYKNFIILEGHSRATIYALQEGKVKDFNAYVLKCDSKELAKWNS